MLTAKHVSKYLDMSKRSNVHRIAEGPSTQSIGPAVMPHLTLGKPFWKRALGEWALCRVILVQLRKCISSIALNKNDKCS
jgi:hypothetical protein